MRASIYGRKHKACNKSEKERAATLEEEAKRQRELEVRERLAREARKAARATLLAKVVVEWSDLKLGKQVTNGGGGGNGGIGAIWEASVDDAAVGGEVRGIDDIRASPRSRALPSPRSMFKLVSPRQLPPPLPAAGARAPRTIAASIAPSLPDGLAARILPDEVVSRHAHEALVEVALALYALSPQERMHPHVLPIVGMATNGVRQYALLTPRCPTSLQRLLHLAESAPAESALSLRLSLIMTVPHRLDCDARDNFWCRLPLGEVPANAGLAPIDQGGGGGYPEQA